MTEPIRVVLVDDQALFRAGIRMVIDSQPDLEVVGEAGDGAEGVRVVRAARPDVVLMDIRMPVMDGLAATGLIREREILEGRRPAMIVMLTANAMDEHIEAARLAGADLHIAKPLRPAQLVTALAAAREDRAEAARVAS